MNGKIDNSNVSHAYTGLQLNTSATDPRSIQVNNN